VTTAHGAGPGLAWLVAVTSTLPVRALTEQLAALAGGPSPRLRGIHRDELLALAEHQPLFAELVEILYNNEDPHLQGTLAVRSTTAGTP
jgi:hypothetical protein